MRLQLETTSTYYCTYFLMHYKLLFICGMIRHHQYLQYSSAIISINHGHDSQLTFSHDDSRVYFDDIVDS